MNENISKKELKKFLSMLRTPEAAEVIRKVPIKIHVPYPALLDEDEEFYPQKDGHQ